MHSSRSNTVLQIKCRLKLNASSSLPDPAEVTSCGVTPRLCAFASTLPAPTTEVTLPDDRGTSWQTETETVRDELGGLGSYGVRRVKQRGALIRSARWTDGEPERLFKSCSDSRRAWRAHRTKERTHDYWSLTLNWFPFIWEVKGQLQTTLSPSRHRQITSGHFKQLPIIPGVDVPAVSTGLS